MLNGLVFPRVQQVLRLRGGGKKRKKKTYTKPKKVKHVHKSVKLAVLKFYRVDDNGKVIRLRKSCPHDDCGVGVRMAVHKDRFYCGSCGLTVRSSTLTLYIPPIQVFRDDQFSSLEFCFLSRISVLQEYFLAAPVE